MIRKLLAIATAAVVFGCGQSTEPPAAENAAPGAVAVATEHTQAAPAPSPVDPLAPRTPVLEREVAYGEAKKSNLVGFLAVPADATEPLPALIVIHEWWGLNDDVKAMARRLAGEGYVALAVDLYGGVTAETPAEAQKLMAVVVADPDAARGNLRQAYEYLEKYAFAPRIGSIGFSFGGGWSLQTAIQFPEQLDAMVMYYGQFVTDRKQLSPLQMPLLALFGGLDESIPTRDVLAFRQTLNQLGKSAKVLIYPHANHSFAVPGGANYDADAAAQAWQEVVAFLNASLKPPAADQTN